MSETRPGFEAAISASLTGQGAGTTKSERPKPMRVEEKLATLQEARMSGGSVADAQPQAPENSESPYAEYNVESYHKLLATFQERGIDNDAQAASTRAALEELLRDPSGDASQAELFNATLHEAWKLVKSTPAQTTEETASPAEPTVELPIAEQRTQEATEQEVQSNKLALQDVRKIVIEHLTSEDPLVQEKIDTAAIFLAHMIDINRMHAEDNISQALQISELFQFTPEQADAKAAEIMAAMQAAEGKAEAPVDTKLLEDQLVIDLSITLEAWSSKVVKGPRRAPEKKLALLEQRKRGIWRRLKMDKLKTTNEKLYNRYNGVIRFRLGQKINILKKEIEKRKVENDLTKAETVATNTVAETTTNSEDTNVAEVVAETVKGPEDTSAKPTGGIFAEINDFIAEVEGDSSEENSSSAEQPTAGSEATEPNPTEEAGAEGETPIIEPGATPPAPDDTQDEGEPDDTSEPGTITLPKDQYSLGTAEVIGEKKEFRKSLGGLLLAKEFNGLFKNLSPHGYELNDFIDTYFAAEIKGATKETAQTARITVLKKLYDAGLLKKIAQNDMQEVRLNELMNRVFGVESGKHAMVNILEWDEKQEGQEGYEELKSWVAKFDTQAGRLFANARLWFRGQRLPKQYNTSYERSVAAGTYDELAEFKQASAEKYIKAAENNPDYVATAAPEKRKAAWKRRLAPALAALAIFLSGGAVGALVTHRSAEVSTNNAPPAQSVSSSPNGSGEGENEGAVIGEPELNVSATPTTAETPATAETHEVFIPGMSSGETAAVESTDKANAAYDALCEELQQRIESNQATVLESLADDATEPALNICEKNPDGTYKITLKLGSGYDVAGFMLNSIPAKFVENYIASLGGTIADSESAEQPVESNSVAESVGSSSVRPGPTLEEGLTEPDGVVQKTTETQTTEDQTEEVAEAENSEESNVEEETNNEAVEFAFEHPWAYYKDAVLNATDQFMVIQNGVPSEATLASITAAQEAGKIVVVENTDLPQENDVKIGDVLLAGTNPQLIEAGAIPISQLVDAVKDYHGTINLYIDGAYDTEESIKNGTKVLEIPTGASVNEVRDLALEQKLPVVFSPDQAVIIAKNQGVALLTPAESRNAAQRFGADDLNAHPHYGGDADAKAAMEILQNHYQEFSDGFEAATSGETADTPLAEVVQPVTAPEKQSATVEPTIDTPLGPGTVTTEVQVEQAETPVPPMGPDLTPPSTESPTSLESNNDDERPVEQEAAPATPEGIAEDVVLSEIADREGQDVVNQVRAFEPYSENGIREAAELAIVLDIINDSTESKLMAGGRLSPFRQVLQDMADGGELDSEYGEDVYEQLSKVKAELQENPGDVDGIVGALGRKIATESPAFAQKHFTYLYENNRFDELKSTMEEMIAEGRSEWFGFQTEDELNTWYNSQLKPAAEAGNQEEVKNLLRNTLLQN